MLHGLQIPRSYGILVRKHPDRPLQHLVRNQAFLNNFCKLKVHGVSITLDRQSHCKGAQFYNELPNHHQTMHPRQFSRLTLNHSKVIN